MNHSYTKRLGATLVTFHIRGNSIMAQPQVAKKKSTNQQFRPLHCRQWHDIHSLRHKPDHLGQSSYCPGIDSAGQLNFRDIVQSEGYTKVWGPSWVGDLALGEMAKQSGIIFSTRALSVSLQLRTASGTASALARISRSDNCILIRV